MRLFFDLPVVVVVLYLIFISTSTSSPLPSHQDQDSINSITSSPFSAALETLQNQISYHFQNVNLLRRAMTHPSFSEENNRVLSILGLNVIETSISLNSLANNLDISPKELNRRITKITAVDSCALEASKLGLQKIIRVSSKTNSSVPAVACSSYRAIFGAVAVDTGKSDDAGNVFWAIRRRGDDDGEALAV